MPLRLPFGRKPLLVLLAGGLAAVPLLPALPETPPMRLTFGIDQRVTVERNQPLSIPADGTRGLAVTRLDLGFRSETPLDALRLDASTLFRLGRTTNGSVSEFQDPRFRFSYSREGSDSGLDVSGSFRRSQVEFLRTLDEFVNDEGELVLPEDFEDLRGEGRRTDYDARFRLELGREAAPLGVTLDASVSGTDYDRAAANLNDRRRSSLGAAFRLRLSPVASGRISLRHSRYREDRTVDPIRRNTDTVQAGVVYDISPLTRIDVGIGWTEIDSNIAGESRSGLNGVFDIGTDLPNGNIGFGVNVNQTVDGTRTTAILRRALDLPDGAISARLGVTRLPRSGDVGLVGGVAWNRLLPTGQVNLRIDRSVVGDDERRFRTVFSTGYSHQISDVSSVSLRFDYSQITASATTNEVRQSNLRATYSHRLTEDWSLNSGVGYRLRNEDGVGRANSPSVFVGIGRQFELPL